MLNKVLHILEIGDDLDECGRQFSKFFFLENMFNDDETKNTEKIYIQFILSDKN